MEQLELYILDKIKQHDLSEFQNMDIINDKRSERLYEAAESLKSKGKITYEQGGRKTNLSLVGMKIIE